MSQSKKELTAIFDVVISLLKDAPFTLVMDNYGSTRGQVYTINKATHKQAETNCSSYTLFRGSAKECHTYLAGMRDYNHYFIC